MSCIDFSPGEAGIEMDLTGFSCLQLCTESGFKSVSGFCSTLWIIGINFVRGNSFPAKKFGIFRSSRCDHAEKFLAFFTALEKYPFFAVFFG